jgi:tetratricopeptide (TPR) repeat protein
MGMTTAAPADAGTRLDADALAALEEEHRFLVRSLEDLEREHDAGDLDDGDYESLKADYAARADAVGAAVDAGRARFADTRRATSPGRRIAIVAGVAAFALLCGVLVAFTVGRRGTGQEATGSVVTSTRQRLAACFAAGQAGQLLEATKCYGEVIKQEPDNAEALTYLGWFLYLASQQSGRPELATDAPGFLARAEAAAPTYPDAHVFLAVIARNEGRIDDARAELDKLDALHPAPSIQQLADQLRAALDGGASTTTAPPAPTTTGPP